MKITSYISIPAYAVVGVLALFPYSVQGDECLCATYWECVTTGGAPYAFCNSTDENFVCCAYHKKNEASAVFTEPPNDLSEEKPGTEVSVSKAKPRHPPILSTSVSPPPPVRLFGDRITRPIISTALKDSIPVKPLVTKSAHEDSDSREDRSKLDAFPQTLVAKPVTNRVPVRLAPATRRPQLTQSLAVENDLNQVVRAATLRVVAVDDVIAVVGSPIRVVPSQISKGDGQTIKLPPGRRVVKVVQMPGGEVTQVNVRPPALLQRRHPTGTSVSGRGAGGSSPLPRKTLSFRPHRAPSSQHPTVHEDHDHEGIAMAQVPPSVREAVRQGFPGREIKRVFMNPDTSRPVLVIGSRVPTVRTLAFAEAAKPAAARLDASESGRSSKLSFRDTQQPHD